MSGVSFRGLQECSEFHNAASSMSTLLFLGIAYFPGLSLASLNVARILLRVDIRLLIRKDNAAHKR